MDIREVEAVVTHCCACEAVLMVDFQIGSAEGFEYNVEHFTMNAGHARCRRCSNVRLELTCSEEWKREYQR